MERPWLGAKLQTVTAEIAESLGLERPVGVLVASVEPGGPAAQAGLKAGDVIARSTARRSTIPTPSTTASPPSRSAAPRSSGVLRAGREHDATVALQTAPETAARGDRHRARARRLTAPRWQSLAGARR